MTARGKRYKAGGRRGHYDKKEASECIEAVFDRPWKVENISGDKGGWAPLCFIMSARQLLDEYCTRIKKEQACACPLK